MICMEKGKVKDFFCATKDEIVDMTLESDMLPTVIADIAETVVSEGTATILGGVVGAIAPGVNGAMLGYRQRRFERNVMQAITIMARRIETIDALVENLSDEILEKFRGIYVEWMLDNLDMEKQKEKVPYHVNGFINLMSDDVNDNLMRMFFETMNELTELDIEVLKMYDWKSDDNIYTLAEKYNLEYEQIDVIKEKLARLGLLKCKNDEQRDEKLDGIVDYLTKLEKDSKSRNPRGVKLPRIKKPSRSHLYSITRLGTHYLNLISEEKVQE